MIGWVKATVALPALSTTTAGELTQPAFSTRAGAFQPSPATQSAAYRSAELVPLR